MRLFFAWGLISVAGCCAIGCSSETSTATGVSPGGDGGTGGQGGSPSVGGSGGDGGTSEGGGGEEPDCWDSDWASWTVDAFDASGLAGEMPREATLTPDGLEVFYEAGPAATPFVLYRAERASLRDDFVGGAPVEIDWTMPSEPLNAVFVAGGQMFFDVNPRGGVAFELASATKEGTGWTGFRFESELNGNGGDSDAHLTDDLLRVVWRRHDGGGTLVENDLWEASRTGGNPGTPFGEPKEIHFSTVANEEAAMVCPVITGDGLTIVFTSTHSQPMASFAAARVYYATRPSTDSTTWSEPVEIETLAVDDGWPCPFSITSDGCQMLVQRVSTDPSIVSQTDMNHARRTPQ